VVLPTLAEAFPGGIDGILKSISYLTDNREFYERVMVEKAEIYHKGNVIYLDELLRDQPSARLILFEMLRPLGFNMSQIDDIIASGHKSGLTFCAGHTTLELDRGKINITSRTNYTPDEIEVNLARDILSPVHIEVSEHPVAAFKPSRNPGMAYFDISVLEGKPKFSLRRWRRGDRITPFGMRGSRLLSDIFSDAKMSAADKRNVWLLTRNGEIIWVVGIRTTDCFPVGPETRRYLQLDISTKQE
ncbi:MAG: tRNA lysidine(34) synthetase TilS, partial [Muribaculaceae bacterium]|nr:tRNA lysidine(34) synthetase TilS [Muribaculaceae bacterium]